MSRLTFGLLSTALLTTGCFAPDDASQASAQSTGEASTGGVDDAESPPNAESSTGSSTGDAPEDDMSTSTTAAPGSQGESSTGAFVDDGSSSGDAEDPTDAGTSTGEACELGTATDCLACGDACSPEGTCTAGGCLEPQTLGHDEAFDDLGGLDGFLWGFPIDLESEATLTHLAFIAGGAGGDVQLSLYTDEAGAPSSRIVTAAPVFAYGPGVHEVAVPSQALEPGTYWIMATATDPTRIAFDLNNGAVNFGVQGIEREFAQGHPAFIEAPNSFVNFRPNFYIRVLAL